MLIGDKKLTRSVIDREKLIRFKTCAACGRTFSLGDTVVVACGGWKGGARFIHEHEAVFDAEIGYVEKKYYAAGFRHV